MCLYIVISLFWFDTIFFWYILQIPALLEKKADASETDSDDDGSSEDSDSGCKESVHPKDKPAEVGMDKKVSWPGIVDFFPTSADVIGKKYEHRSEWFLLLFVWNKIGMFCVVENESRESEFHCVCFISVIF